MCLKDAAAAISLLPCRSCVKLSIHSSIKNTVMPKPDMQSAQWQQEFLSVRQLLQASGLDGVA